MKPYLATFLLYTAIVILVQSKETNNWCAIAILGGITTFLIFASIKIQEKGK